MQGKFRILMISHHRKFKAYARCHVMAKNLVARGHEVSLMVTSDVRCARPVISDWDGVKTLEMPDLLWGRLRSGWDPWDMLNRIAYLLKQKDHFDLIHCFETRPITIYPALIMKNRDHLPLVTDWNDWFGRKGLIEINRPKWYRYLLGWMETYYEEAFRAPAAGLTVISTALANRAVGLGVPADRICYIPGGTFPEIFVCRPVEECRRKLNLTFSGPVLGFSSLDSHLDMDLILSSLAILVERYPEIRCIITGTVNKQTLNSMENSGLMNHLLLTGFLPMEQLPWYLGCADLFLLPYPPTVYNIGRWPNKIGDFMCLGRPTVTNPTGDMKDLFETHRIGLLADNNPQDFVQKISTLIENPALAQELGQNASRVAVEEYDWRILTDRLVAFYERILTPSLN